MFAASFLKKLEKLGLVKKEKKGRQNFVVLTESGVSLSVSCDDFWRKIEAVEKASAAQSAQQSSAGAEKKPERSTDVV